jgi:hypothetical protein
MRSPVASDPLLSVQLLGTAASYSGKTVYMYMPTHAQEMHQFDEHRLGNQIPPLDVERLYHRCVSDSHRKQISQSKPNFNHTYAIE